MSLRIGLKADAGSRAGFGHLSRCLALAQAFEKLGQRPVFLDVPKQARAWLKSRGGRAASFSGRYDVLVGDSYRFTAGDVKKLRSRAKVLLMVDDLGTYRGPADWVLNGHLYAHDLTFRANGGAGLLLGPKFLPMRREYWAPRKKRAFPPRARNILLTLGGAASAALLAKVEDAIERAVPGARVWLATSVPSLRPLLEKCDLVVCAGGQTLYEAIFTGTPAVAVELGANQRGNLSSAHAAGVAVNAGRPGKDLKATIRRAAFDQALRRRLSRSSAGLLDGKGALRVARALLAEARKA